MSDAEEAQETITLQQVMDAYIMLKHDVGGLAAAVQQDMEKINFLLFHLLKDLGKVVEDVCPSCNAEMMLPIFDSAKLDKVCNICGWTEDEEEDSPEGEEE